MRRINVITQKELVDASLLTKCTAVVIDVFLATSTITYFLAKGYEPVYAVKAAAEGRKVRQQLEGPSLLMGELNGEAIEGFQYPDPTILKQVDEHPRAAIICSTNGTVAAEKARNAKRLYASSLLNGHKVAEQISKEKDETSIVIICSGNAGRFSMEDIVGAGHMIDHLVKSGDYKLSDAAIFARDAFLHSRESQFQNLLASETAHLLENTGYGHTSEWVIDHFEQIDIVPILEGDKFIRKR